MPNYMMNPGNYPANLNLTEYQRQALIQMLTNAGPNQNMQNMQWSNGMMPQNNAPQGFSPSGQTQGQPIEFKGVFIDNFEQAKGYPVPLGGSAIMMDKNNLMLYIKQVDGDCNPAYVKYELKLVDGQIGQQTQTQQIQTQNTPVENNNQQSKSNQNQVEQMLTDLLNGIKQLKENQDSLEKKVYETLSRAEERIKQLENSANTVQGGH